MADNIDRSAVIKTEPTPGEGATKKAQLLLRRKLASQWEGDNTVIPFGEPCFSYDPNTGDYILKIGALDDENKLMMWNNLNLLRCRVDDGELE